MKTVLSIAAFSARLLPGPVKRAIYRVGPLARVLRGTLNKAVPSGLVETEVAAGGLEGVRLWLDLKIEKDYWLGTYEAELQTAIQDFVKPGMVVFDVGANIGYITLLLSRQIGSQGEVYAFEALPVNVERIHKNVSLAGLPAKVTVVAGAVTEENGPIRFMVHESTSMGKAIGSAGRTDEKYQQEITVDGISLDNFVFEKGNPAPQLIKMDIEGGEVSALPGMQRLIDEFHPLMFVELHGHDAARTVFELLSSAGYEICRMMSGYPVVHGFDDLDWKAYIVARWKKE